MSAKSTCNIKKLKRDVPAVDLKELIPSTTHYEEKAGAGVSAMPCPFSQTSPDSEAVGIEKPHMGHCRQHQITRSGYATMHLGRRHATPGRHVRRVCVTF